MGPNIKNLMSMMVFWVVTPRGLACPYQRLRRDILPLSLELMMEATWMSSAL
jgi:hypothetical protein